MTTCACGEFSFEEGAHILSVYSDGIQHFGPDLICVATDELLIDGGAQR